MSFTLRPGTLDRIFHDLERQERDSPRSRDQLPHIGYLIGPSWRDDEIENVMFPPSGVDALRKTRNGELTEIEMRDERKKKVFGLATLVDRHSGMSSFMQSTHEWLQLRYSSAYPGVTMLFNRKGECKVYVKEYM